MVAACVLLEPQRCRNPYIRGRFPRGTPGSTCAAPRIEMLEFVDGFEVEGEGLVIAQQQPLLFQRASDAGGDSVEQAQIRRRSRESAH